MMGLLMDGGWMMIPLLICSIVMVAVIIDRCRCFRAAAKLDPEALRAEVKELLEVGKVDEAVAACEKSDGPVAAVILKGLERLKVMVARQKPQPEIEAGVTKAMEDYAPKALGGLEKRLGTMVLVASISPLIGMTGTVTGMINSFSVMAEAAGLDPGAVAGGISEALITTAAGLIIAIPGVVAYNMFQRKVEEWTAQLESAVAEVSQAIGA